MKRREMNGLAVALAAAALAAAGPAGAAQPTGVCPPAFDQLTFAEALAIAHELGVPFSDEEILAAFTSLDTNRDETLCFQDLPDTPGIPFHQFNVIDNTAKVPR
jgi:hypothetical protein